MTLKLSVPKDPTDLKPRITVVGIGGAGGNAVNNMVRANLVGCEFVACNTDAQALRLSAADRKIQLGQSTTRGLGAGARPDVGRAAAEEAMDELMEHLKGSNMVFITAGMGGGTGTGAAPVVARAARENGILTVGVVTKPFHFEGPHRMRLAEAGIEELQKFVDTLLIIPNQNLFRVANERTTFAEAFKMADDVLHAGVRGVTDLMVMEGLINLDFSDIRTVMSEMGKAMMGTGEASGEKRALEAAEAAISNPLLDDVSMKGAKGVLINITGGADMTLFEVDEAANRIREEVDPEANIIFGSTFDDKLEGRMRISVVATGIDAELSRIQGERVNAANPAEPRRAGQPVPTPANEATPAAAAASDLFRETAGSHSVAAMPPAGPGDAIPANIFVTPVAAQPTAPRGDGREAVSPPLSQRASERQRAPEPRGPEPKQQPASSSFFSRLVGRSAPPHPTRNTPPTLASPRQPAPHPRAATAMPPVAGAAASSAHPGGEGDEDYLEIPAFLRRQAN